jgi:hypothetical protein
MRTTLSIDDNLLERAKKRAAERGITLGRYVDEALREHLTVRRAVDEKVELPTFDGGDVRPGVDLTSNRALYDLLDEEGGHIR